MRIVVAVDGRIVFQDRTFDLGDALKLLEFESPDFPKGRVVMIQLIEEDIRPKDVILLGEVKIVNQQIDAETSVITSVEQGGEIPAVDCFIEGVFEEAGC